MRPSKRSGGFADLDLAMDLSLRTSSSSASSVAAGFTPRAASTIEDPTIAVLEQLRKVMNDAVAAGIRPGHAKFVAMQARESELLQQQTARSQLSVDGHVMRRHSTLPLKSVGLSAVRSHRALN